MMNVNNSPKGEFDPFAKKAKNNRKAMGVYFLFLYIFQFEVSIGVGLATGVELTIGAGET